MALFFYPSMYSSVLSDLDDLTSLAKHLEQQPTAKNIKNRRTVMSSCSDLRVHEDNEKYTVSIDVPGIKREDLTIQVEETKDNGRVLALTGLRKMKQGSSESEVKLERRFSLGDDVDTDQIDANLEYGVLEVTMKKKAKEEQKPKTKVISIKQEASNE